MSLLVSALNYLKAGLSVVATGTDKLPCVGASWKQYQIQAASEEELKRWYTAQAGSPHHNKQIALVCGRVSGGLEMIDFDCKALWFEPWAELVKEHAPGLFERLVIEKSQSGGKHVCYRIQKSEGGDQKSGNQKLAQQAIEVDAGGTPAPQEIEIEGKKYKPRKGADGKFRVIRCLVETRGEGGYFLCAPSAKYELLQGSFEALPVLTAAEREFLIGAGKVLNEWVPDMQAGSPHHNAGKMPAVQGERPGDAFNNRGDVAGLLRKHGWAAVGEKGPRSYWRRPGKAKGWSATLAEGKIFYVFSSNAEPFESEKSYMPFAVYAMLECGGDFKEATKRLRKEGFGAPLKKAGGTPAPQATVEEQTKAKTWLDEEYKEDLQRLVKLDGVERDAKVMELFRLLAVALQGQLKATFTRVRNDVRKALDLNKGEFDAILREASAREEGGGGGEGDWTSMAKRFLRWLAGKEKGKPKAALKLWRDEWYMWRASWGCYRLRKPKWVRSRLFTRYLMRHGISISTKAVSDFAQAIEGLTILDDECEPGRWLRGTKKPLTLPSPARGEGEQQIRADGRYLAMANGILDLDSLKVEADPDQLEFLNYESIVAAPLLPHSPDYWQTFALPYKFDGKARCPRLIAALTLWQSAPEVLQLLQDWAGYIFCPGQPYQRMLLLHGPGGDGKSQYLRLLSALAGDENTSAVGLEGFDPSNNFGLWPMVGKLLNVIGDVNQVDRLGEGRLKSVVGGDRMTVDRKKIEPVTVTLGAKLVANCNALPGFRDRSEGIWRRLFVVKWKSLPPSVIKVDFADELIKDEMSGIFNWAIQGYLRMKDHGFVVTGILQKWAEASRAEVQAEIEFFEECVETRGEADSPIRLKTEDLTGAYKRWCDRNNTPASLYGKNLGGPLRRWLKTKKLVELKKNAGEIEMFLDEENENAEKRFKQRGNSGQRKEFYRGVWLQTEALSSTGDRAEKELW